MSTERRFVGLVLSLAVGTTGCVSTSIQSDLARVHELTHAPLPQNLTTVKGVDPEMDESVKQLLQDSLTADEAVRIALLNNREFRATLREVGVARGRLLQASLLPNPEFELEMHVPSVAGRPPSPTLAEFVIEYDLTQAILAPVRANVAQANLEATRYRAAATVVGLGYNARTAYYALQAAQQRLAIAMRALDAFAAARDMSRALFEAGNVPELDVATQEAAYEAARATVAQLELELLDRREQLQRLLGLHGNATTWTVANGLARLPEEEPSYEDLERKAITASLELAESRSRLEAAARSTGLSRAEGWIPDVAIGALVEQETHLDVAGQSPWTWGGVINFTLPVFNRRQGTSVANEAEFDALMERYHGMSVDIRSAAREARNRVRSAHLRARQYQEVLLPARRRVMQQTLLQYNAMQIGIFQLLQARRDELDAELTYVETLREYWTARAALDALLAGARVSAPMAAGTSSSFAGGDEPSGGH
jgi:outer membrane protein, heavy metal efflux system